jgi:carbon dioxide concentrating mechanism protein ccmK-like protein
MNALGFIETTGLIAAIEAADVMVKSANVSLVKKEYVGKGLVTVVIEGDVGAVSCAIDAGVEAVKTLGNELFAYNVIPSPAQELSIFVNEKEENIEENLDIVESISASTKENIISNSEENISGKKDIEDKDIDLYTINNKEDLDRLVEKYGIETCTNMLEKLANRQLKKIIGEHDENIALNKANKKQLISLIEEFYKY